MYMKYAVAVCSLFFFHFIVPSFPQNTFIATEHGYFPIQHVEVGDSVACIDASGNYTFRVVTDVQQRQVHECIILEFDHAAVVTTPDQKIYCSQNNAFKKAKEYAVGDTVLTASRVNNTVRSISIEQCDQLFFDITVAEYHNFFIGEDELLVHNMEPVTIGLAWAFGSGAIEFVGASIGTIVCGAWVGLKMHRDKEGKNGIDSFDIYTDDIDDLIYSNEAQAPGKPTEKDGYIPPKRWDGKKVKHKRGWGYPDEKGRIWIPTGNGGTAHGGPHWDVQYPGRSKDYDNVFPGGKIKKGKK